MIEVYAFLAVFAAQILAMSFLFPARLIRYASAQATSVSAERLAQLYPGVDHELASARFFTRIRVGSVAVAAIGLSLLGWLFNYMRRPDWDLGTVIALNGVFYFLQYVPLLLAAWFAFRLYKAHEQSPSEGKRTATLERRGLFDYVSPFTFVVAVVAYLLFVTCVIVFQREPFPGFLLIGVLTLAYALHARDVYRALYGKKRGPLDTRAVRAHRTGYAVRFNVYGCIVLTVFFAFAFTIDLLDQKKWVPFAMSVLFVTITLLMSTVMTSLLRQSETNT